MKPISPEALSVALAVLALSGCNAADVPSELEDSTLAQSRQALTVILQPGPEGKDSGIFSLPGSTGTPGGASHTLSAVAWTYSGVPGVRRGLIEFDLQALPAGSTVNQAILTLSANLNTSPPGHSQLTGTNEWRLLPITAPWSEDTVTWDTQPATDPSGAISLPASTSNSQAYPIDVTSLVRRELASPTTQHGWMLQLQTEQHYRALQFASSDHPDPTLRPRLVIDYLPPVIEGTIRGRVITNTGNGIAGVRVDAGNGRFAMTGTDGGYTLSNLPLGSYTLRASRNGWAFGSREFQDARYTVSITSAGQTVLAPAIIGWNFDPIVFVHGWTSSPGEFDDVPGAFWNQGYFVTARQLETSVLWTPPLEVNARRVKEWIDEAKWETGRGRVILYGSSMGGLVARAYVEGGQYANDVSQLFTYGSPHRGIPAMLNIGCAVVRPDAVCQMTQPGMALFNLTHFKRSGVDYHLIAGKAPMWTERRECFRIFRRNICISIPWPDTSYRNTAGWAMGALIPGEDDGFIQTWSASGMVGLNIDRFLTREVHMSRLGPRTYHDWSGGVSQEGFGQCARRILIDRNTTTCGSRAWPGPPPGSFLVPSSLNMEEESAAPDLHQASRIEQDVLLPGEQRIRLVTLEGGPTTFTTEWSAGTVRFKLVDPTGKVIDPEYADSIRGDPTDPEAEEVTEPDPDAVIYSGVETRAEYYFPAARRGTWQLVLEGGSDIPAEGTSFTSLAAFDSPLKAGFSSDRVMYGPGGTALLRVLFSEPVQSAQIEVALRQAGHVVERIRLNPVHAGEYSASYRIPALPGYAMFDWALTGVRADGTAFERGGREFIQIHAGTLRLEAGHTDHAIPREDGTGLNSALAVTLKVLSDYEGGELGVAAELVGPDESFVSHTLSSVPARLGANAVELRFRAEDIYLSGRDGPYSVRNVKLLDQRDAPLLSQEIDLAYTTGAYAYRSFAPELGTPSVFLDGPFRVMAGESIELTVTGADPEGDPLSYAWDLDDDGEFELSGQTVTFSTSAQDEAGLRTIRVRATDPADNTAVTESSLEIFVPAGNRPPVARCRSVTVPSDASCGASDSVNDGSYDPDEEDTLRCVQTPAGPYALGSWPVTLTCTDAAGLSSSCEATVTVVESSPLTLRLNGASDTTLECGVDTWTDPGAQAWAACGPLEVHRYNSGSDPYGPGPNSRAEGVYSVQYMAWDHSGSTVSATRTVRVEDRTAPVLRLMGPEYMTHTCGSAWVDPGVEAMDACYGDVGPAVITSGDYVNGWVPGVYMVRYEVTDSGGNSAPPVTRTVLISNCPW